ncbi:UTP--glucose-1-phosphate uridylyltransferase GalU [Silvimonas sp. JCM 19000]
MPAQPVRKAVFPVAGFGTRFLPMTKASPKEMLPIVDKPLIQYAVEEAAAAGITQMIFVTGRGKRNIEDHFDKAYELEAELAAHGKDELLKQIQSVIPDNLSFTYTRQVEQRGLGHAVLCAQPLVGNEPFVVILADDLIDAETPAIRQLLDVYEEYSCSVIGMQSVPAEDTKQYGIISGSELGPRLYSLDGIVEKPDPADAPSNFGVVGRYVFTPDIFEVLAQTAPGKGDEIQLTDAIETLRSQGKPIRAYAFEGERYDCGSKLGYLCATVDYGLRHPDLGAAFARYLGVNLPYTPHRVKVDDPGADGTPII